MYLEQFTLPDGSQNTDCPALMVDDSCENQEVAHMGNEVFYGTCIKAKCPRSAAKRHEQGERIMAEQEWGPCGKCGGRYTHKTVGAYGMDAFKIESITCIDCGFVVTWEDDPDRSAPAAWKRTGSTGQAQRKGGQ